MLAERKGSITVSAMLGTGLVTLGVAFTGMAGLGTDLRAATKESQPPAAPALGTEDVQETLREERLSKKLQADCPDHRRSRDEATGATGPREL